MKMKFLKSFHPCLPDKQACKSVIQTIYDIVKAHGGKLKVETKVYVGSEFIIVLPV